MKTVPFFPNSSDNTHCLQACVKSVLACYFPDKKFTDEEIDRKTGQIGGWSWLPPAVVWLDDLGLKVKLHSSFDYFAFSERGEGFLRENWGIERFEQEKSHRAFDNLSFVQKATKRMIKRELWKKEVFEADDLSNFLKGKDGLAIGKTIHEWLDGKYIPGNAHYVVVIKDYSPHQWLVHDPGLPQRPKRTVAKIINNHSIFGDVLLIGGRE